MRRTPRIAAALLAWLPLACSGGGGAEDTDTSPFQYRSSEDVGLNVTVTRGGAPLAGASVSVVGVLSADEVADAAGSGTPYFTGGTDETGVCASVLSIPTSVERVDVVVHHDGSAGPYSVEALRTHWGPFAPSSRTTVRVVDLGAVAVPLEAR